jgi:tetratricopeptide (TPR) repeat protein
MLARFLLFAAALAPLSAQDVEVTKYLDEIRAQSRIPAVDPALQRQEMVAGLRKSLEVSASLQRSVNLYLQIGMFEDDPQASLAAYRKARALAPGNVQVAISLAAALSKQEQDAEADEIYRSVLGVDPHDAVALMHRAREILDQPGDLDLGVALAQRALGLSPGDPEIRDTLGLTHLRKGLAGNAILVYNQLVADWPGVSTYHYHLALALSQRGTPEAAIPELEAALKCHPPDEERTLIEKLLRSSAAEER